MPNGFTTGLREYRLYYRMVAFPVHRCPLVENAYSS
jgi:hypothetical protein